MEVFVTVIVSTDVYIYDDSKPTSFLLFFLNAAYLVEKEQLYQFYCLCFKMTKSNRRSYTLVMII